MKNRLTKVIASAALAAGLIIAAPAMAQAYTPTGSDTVTITVTGSGTFSFDGFTANASIDFTLVGENASSGSLGRVKLAVDSLTTTKTADASGSVSVAVTLPANASGDYTLSATGERAGSSAGSGGATLPSTGGDSESLLGIWVGGGALVLAGATVAVATTVRRNRQETKA